MLKLSVLEAIHKHLKIFPGEYKWRAFAFSHGCELVDFYDHLNWLRINEFTLNDKGKIRLSDRTMDELYAAAREDGAYISPSIAEPPKTSPQRIPKTDFSNFSRIKKPKKMAPLPKEPKSKKVKKEKKASPSFTQAQCLAAVEKIAFAHKTLPEIALQVPGFHPKILHTAIIKAGGTVFYAKGSGIPVYFKFSSVPCRDQNSHLDSHSNPPLRA
jgi:hypothetical protein